MIRMYYDGNEQMHCMFSAVYMYMFISFSLLLVNLIPRNVNWEPFMYNMDQLYNKVATIVVDPEHFDARIRV